MVIWSEIRRTAFAQCEEEEPRSRGLEGEGPALEWRSAVQKAATRQLALKVERPEPGNVGSQSLEEEKVKPPKPTKHKILKNF